MFGFLKPVEPEPEGPRPIAKLDEADFRKVKEQRRLLNDAEMTVSMLRCSYRVLWAALKEKHGLPDEVELDEETGEVFPPREPPRTGGA